MFQRWVALLLGFWALSAMPSMAAPLKIVTDISPVAHLIRVLLGDDAHVTQLVEPGLSPHDWQLRPSQARSLVEADYIIWVGPDLTPSLSPKIKALVQNGKVITLSEVNVAHRLAARGEHLHDDHHEDEDRHDDHAHDEIGHDVVLDPHIWLHPENVSGWAQYLAQEFAAHNIDLSAKADEFSTKLHEISKFWYEHSKKTAVPKFALAHDALQYGEDWLEQTSQMVFSLAHGQDPGARAARALAKALKTAEVTCVIKDPNEPSAFVDRLLKDLSIKSISLDPLGNALPREDYWDILYGQLASAILTCSSYPVE